MVERRGDARAERFGLTEEALALICGIFLRHPEVRRVKLFGSRAADRFEEGSDVDLVLWGQVDQRLLGQIARELDELPLPYTFDVKTYETIRHEPLRRQIDRTGSILYAC